MKKNTLLVLCVIAAFFTTANAMGQKTSLSISDCPYALQIVAGTSFKFPDSLGKYDLILSENAAGYTLKGSGTEAITGTNIQTITQDGSGTTIVTSGGKITTVKSNNGNNSVFVGGTNSGTIIVNGVVISGGKPTTKTLKIVVPKGINLSLVAENDVTISAPLNKVQIGCEGSVTVKIDSCKSASSVALSGSGDITITKCSDIISSISISGSGEITIGECRLVSNILISGSGDVTVKKCPSISNIIISGSGTVSVQRNTTIGSQMITGSGEILKE